MKQPGDKLGSSMEYMPGSGVYEINGELIAGVCGELKEDNKTMEISIVPSVSVPIEIIHGWNDDVVPVENSMRFAESSKANLHILNSDHGLTDNLDNINCIFENFIERCSANRKL